MGFFLIFQFFQRSIAMRNFVIGFSLLVAAGFTARAQQVNRPSHFHFPKAAEITVSDIQADYFPKLQLLEAPAPDGGSERAAVARMKEEMAARYTDGTSPASKAAMTAPSPWMGDNFRSNINWEGVPNDNDMAVSNGGKIVSVINSSIWMQDTAGTALATVSLDAWAAPLGLTGDKFDPRALYDPVHDRFILTCLNGFTNSTSYVIVGFSQTNDPTGAWNLYALPGDPRGDTLWTDYPIMAITPHELFLTANLLFNNQPWQTGFSRSLCWQIDLDGAYSGSLDVNLWDSVYYGNRPVRNLCPIQGGSMPSGNGIYLLSNRNLSPTNDSLWIMRIGDTIGAPGLQMTVTLAQTNVAYGMPPNALEQFNQQLATNDARWLDGFIENDRIQFVGNTLDPSTGRAGIYHGIIRDVSTNPVVEGHIIGNPDGSYGYPGIAWMGMTPSSHEALIGLNYVGTTPQHHPGCGAIFYDGQSDYSERVVARAGSGYLNALSGSERWGDYFGIQRRYNQSGVVWIAGTWAQTNRQQATWIAEFHHPAIVGTTAPQPQPSASTAPNPFTHRVVLEFSLPEDDFVEVALYDLAGALQRVFVRDRARAGLNRFTFSTEPLAAGAYMIRVTTEGGLSFSERVVKLD
jgi:hypothetical protein